MQPEMQLAPEFGQVPGRCGSGSLANMSPNPALPLPQNYLSQTPAQEKNTWAKSSTMGKPQRRATLLGYEQPLGAGDDETQGSAKRQDHFAPRRKRWNLDADAIIQKLNCHTSFQVREGYELTDLPRFSDTANYQVSETEQFDLWTFEVKRLVSIANDPNSIEMEGGLDEWFGAADRDGYLGLDKLATQLNYAISICILDNELLLLEFDPAISNPANFLASRTRLSGTFGPEITVSLTRGSVRLTRENDRCYQAMVNYVTGTLVRVLLRTVEGELWDQNVVLALAKLAAKLKVVGIELEKTATMCLAGAREWDHRLRQQQRNDFAPPSSENKSGGARNKQVEAAQTVFGQWGHEYFSLMDAFHQCIAVLISQVAGQLRSDSLSTAVTDSFETCSIMYDTGFQQARAMLCQERTGAIGGSGHRSDVHCAGFAFEVCLAVLEKLRERDSAAPSAGMPYTSVYWKWTRILAPKAGDEGVQLARPRTGELHLASMRDVITAFVPFVMVCGGFPRQLHGMVGSVHLFAKPGATKTCDDVPALASFMLRTSSYRSTADPEVTSVSESPIARKRALAQWPSAASGTAEPPRPPVGGNGGIIGAESTDDGALQADLREANADVARVLTLIDSWIIDETSIIVPYRRYCWGALGLCGGLVVGGLAIGFSVEERIHGVDPFNISTFCWVLAGFIILVAKSIRVQEWPWRDFVLGRVVCKSVSEVVAVTWVDAQLLLSILLRLEPVMLLNKRGPFETIFTRRNPETGFAIDVPLGTAAVNEGGCFFVKVQCNTGPAIMCLRTNYSHEYNSIAPQSRSEERGEVKCDKLDTPWCWGKGPDKGPLYPMMTNAMAWTRVIGLQGHNAYFD